jgi:hypothetical protein
MFKNNKEAEMKFITVRDLATKNRKTRKIMSSGDSVLTLNGKPIAYMIPINEDNFEYVVNEAVQIRAAAAIEAMRKKSEAAGLTEEDGRKIVAEYRRKRAKSRKVK